MTEKENIDFFNAVKGKKLRWRPIDSTKMGNIFIPQSLSEHNETMEGFWDINSHRSFALICNGFEIDNDWGHWEFVEDQDKLDYEKSKVLSNIQGNIKDITISCSHPKKYVNRATLKAFWVCPDCKADLGDV